MNFIRKKKSNIWNNDTEEQQGSTRWEQDYVLADTPPLGLFDEYLEMGKSWNSIFTADWENR